MQHFGCKGVNIFVADGAGENFFTQLAFECALGGLQRQFADMRDINALMNQEPDDVIKRAVFKPLL
ncbi:hypothetical protein D3C76_1824660 [compost metagenome]